MDRDRRHESDDGRRDDRDRERGKDRDERNGSRERDRDRGKDDDRVRERVKSPSPRRERSRSPPPRNNNEGGNPGNNLYVSGLSSRTTERDLEEHFGKEGKVADCRLVADPRTKESRGFAFIMMDTRDDANRCVKYLDRSVLQGRVITVALAKRSRPRTPTPGKFLGVRPVREMEPQRESFGDRRGAPGGGEMGRDPNPPRRSSPDYGPYRRNRSPDYGPYSRGRY